jgi:type IV pilus assembly protein PilP
MSASDGRTLRARSLVSLAALLLTGTVALAAGRERATHRERASQKKPATAVPAGPVAEPAPGPVAAMLSDDRPFDPAGRRDPFRPPRATVSTRSGEPPTPLQRYEIGQLKLVAIIYDTEQPRAVVEDDQGLGYIVRVGTAIGANGGRVRNIERGRVLIEEDSVDFYGENHLSNVVMELRTAEGGKQ